MAVAALVVSVLALLVAVAGTLVALRQASAADRSASAAQRSAELADRSATAAEESARAAAASDARDADRRADELAEREAEPRRRIVNLRASVDLAMDSRYRDAAFLPGWRSLPGGDATIEITNPGDEPLVVDRLRLVCVQGDGPVSENYSDTPGRTVLPVRP